jgi:rhodanese-related sulfurtransferase
MVAKPVAESRQAVSRRRGHGVVIWLVDQPAQGVSAMRTKRMENTLFTMMLSHEDSVGSSEHFPGARKGLLFLLLASLIGGCQGVSDKSIQVIGGLELRRMLEGKGREQVVLVDPRHPEDFAKCHLPGAWNIRLNDLPPNSKPVGRLARYEAIVVYGENPGSIPAKAMAKRLLAIGYSGVKFFPGGIEEWVDLGGRVETSIEKSEPRTEEGKTRGGGL